MNADFDLYTVRARFFPCILSALPLIVLTFFLSADVELSRLGQYLGTVKPYAGVGLSVVGLYFYAEVIRFISKLLEQSYFLKRSGFPTTYLMMYADSTHSKDYKNRYREKVKRDFDMELLDETGKASEPAEGQKRLAEATKQVILKVGKGKLVFKHNIWYGFIRNLIGGAPFAVVFCLVNVVVSLTYIKSTHLAVVSLVLAVPYTALLIFWKPLLSQNAEAYANQLIAEYMAEKN
ncbi:MAG: hypothetical protein JW993_15495 [Sedimentisphaerales bacterium]|nr:hypothetical protein [Sedimentisphaerales bacterium]